MLLLEEKQNVALYSTCLCCCKLTTACLHLASFSSLFIPLLRTSALGLQCVQVCNAAKGEKKSPSRRQVRCNFNLKLKAPSQLVSN